MSNKSSYANAKDVLPAELVEQIQEHFSGKLYIPNKRPSNQNSDLIIKLAKAGAEVEEIADIVGVSTRRVNQVISRKRRKIWEWAD
jgi:DNA-binding NarL/FixJ family response regulator